MYPQWSTSFSLPTSTILPSSILSTITLFPAVSAESCRVWCASGPRGNGRYAPVTGISPNSTIKGREGSYRAVEGAGYDSLAVLAYKEVIHCGLFNKSTRDREFRLNWLQILQRAYGPMKRPFTRIHVAGQTRLMCKFGAGSHYRAQKGKGNQYRSVSIMISSEPNALI